MKLTELPRGSAVYVDANIFLYHLHGASEQCRDFVASCERGDFRPVCSTETLIEVAHRAMLAEAVVRGWATPRTVSRRLKERPELVGRLEEYRVHVGRVRSLVTSVVPVTIKLLERALALGPALRLLLRDALVVAAAEATVTKRLASADRDFERVPGIELYAPSDLRFVGL
jgi:predicted nucleic acid-binding protein